ncbi:hypothetical protein LN040_15085 [Desulfovibrio subterraneus]|uniref:hypothetical protein n=1 Tax=Desulfovibrio subterraneus TaxID=2718620 RepID=UPI0022B9217D|nr:hypothetical protein [Desulfovibrio subterraneus]WBF67023.1 hypothetical protein LN040_15085 [Desulfovibrio subterraneus]
MLLNTLIGYFIVFIFMLLVVELVFSCFRINLRRIFVCRRLGISLSEATSYGVRMIRASDRFVHGFVFFTSSIALYSATINGIEIISIGDIVFYTLFFILMSSSVVLLVAGYYHCVLVNDGTITFVGIAPWCFVKSKCDSYNDVVHKDKVKGGINLGKIFLSEKEYVVSFDVSGICSSCGSE